MLCHAIVSLCIYIHSLSIHKSILINMSMYNSCIISETSVSFYKWIHNYIVTSIAITCRASTLYNLNHVLYIVYKMLYYIYICLPVKSPSISQYGEEYMSCTDLFDRRKKIDHKPLWWWFYAVPMKPIGQKTCVISVLNYLLFNYVYTFI